MWALVNAGTVTALSVAQDVPSGFVSTGTVTPQIGWTYDGGTFTEPVAMQGAALLGAGCQITSAGTPALSGTYSTTPAAQQYIQAEMIAILTNGAFADGASSIEWLDAGGASHTMTVPQFKAFASAIAAFVSGCMKCVNGQSSSLPAQPSSIA